LDAVDRRRRSRPRPGRCAARWLSGGRSSRPAPANFCSGRAAKPIEFAKKTIELAEQSFNTVGDEQIEFAEEMVELAEKTLNSARPWPVDLASAIGCEQVWWRRFGENPGDGDEFVQGLPVCAARRPQLV
jgi:hypothetical protein